MAEKVYENSQKALEATNDFYLDQEGFQYTGETAKTWIKNNISFKPRMKILDLCCGDGIWSRGFQLLDSSLEIYGVDISIGGIEKARKLLGVSEERFKVCDAEKMLPFPENYFDVIFARGPGLFNQHSMKRPATVKVIEMWHRKLKPVSGRFYSIFASNPKLIDYYTPMDQCKLPYNRSPRKTPAVDFTGGKFHHSIRSFHEPFWAAENVTIKDYTFKNNLHILISSNSV